MDNEHIGKADMSDIAPQAPPGDLFLGAVIGGNAYGLLKEAATNPPWAEYVSKLRTAYAVVPSVDLQRRFVSKRVADYLGASWELLYAGWFSNRGFTIQRYQQNNLTPDYRVKGPGREFVLEVFAFRPSELVRNLRRNSPLAGIGFIGEAARLSRHLAKKRSRYRTLKSEGIPLVIGVGTGHGTIVYPLDMEQALYGKLVVNAVRGSQGRIGPLTIDRGRTGFFRDTAAGPVNTTISWTAFAELRPAGLEMRFFENPYAANPLSQEEFSGFARLAVSETSANRFVLNWRDEVAAVGPI